MDMEDLVEPEVGVAVALTAVVASPKVRSYLRKGAVYGLAGLLMASDAVTSFTKSTVRGAREAAASVVEKASEHNQKVAKK